MDKNVLKQKPSTVGFLDSNYEKLVCISHSAEADFTLFRYVRAFIMRFYGSGVNSSDGDLSEEVYIKEFCSRGPRGYRRWFNLFCLVHKTEYDFRSSVRTLLSTRVCQLTVSHYVPVYLQFLHI